MKKLNGSKILVVGGAGFIGSNLINLLLSYDIKKIIIVDNLLSSEKINIPYDRRISFINGSISNNNILNKIDNDINYVWHLACFHGNQASIKNPLDDHENNLITTLKLYEKLKNFKYIKKVVYSSAGCSLAEKTYQTPKATKESFIAPIKHDSPYSISKLVGEMYSFYYFKNYKLPVVISRFQNVYGENEILGAGRWRGHISTIWRNVVPTFIWKSLNNDSIKLENAGQNSRDFIHVSDIVKGLILCSLKGKSGEIYNLGSGNETKIKELANKIIRICKSSSKLFLSPKRKWDESGRRFASILKSKNNLNFSCKISLDAGLRRTIKWTSDNRNLIEKNIKKHNKFIDFDK